MEEKTAAALARRLAAYSATAGVALAVAPGARAQIVYHDLDPDVVMDLLDSPGSQRHFLDLDDDGDFDVVVAGYNYNVGRGAFLRVILDGTGTHPVRFLGYPSYSGAGGIVSRLASGDPIVPAGNFFDFARAAEYDFYYNEGHYPFLGEGGYAGFRFIGADGEYHYGWLRLAVTDRAEVTTVFEYAYKTRPNTFIRAGARSDALLQGDVNQTSFPPEGGTLVYTFTVENPTNDQLSLDLWVDADGPAAFTRRLGSGTLPPGTTLVRTVQVRVPAGAPAGDYDVRFKLGQFSTGAFLTFERFEITKEAADGAADGTADGAEAFAVDPFEGDLFADAEAASIPGTHALSAPVPNPTTGQAEVALSVASAQPVRVEVLDALGRRVALLHDGPMAAGEAHRLVFDGSGLPAGVYVVRAVGATFTDARVVSLTR